MTLLNYMSVSPRARKLAIDVFRKFPPGEFLTTKQIYEEVIQKDVKTDLARVPLPALGKRGAVWRNKKGNIALPSMSLPPHPDHPVRSVRYLKKRVLESLAEEGIIEKIHRKRVPEEPSDLERWEKKRARLERRNALRMVSGIMPKLMPQKEVSEWFWRVKKGGSWEEAKKKVEEEEAKEKEKEKDVEGTPTETS